MKSVKPVPELATINGACHCGNIRLVLHWPESETNIPVRKCGCSFCQKHAAAWTSHGRAQLVVDIDDPALVSHYRFGTQTADFGICRVCGVVPFALSEIDNTRYAIVNASTLEDVGRFSFSSSATDFDGEDVDGRLTRRQRKWISRVLINETGA